MAISLVRVFGSILEFLASFDGEMVRGGIEVPAAASAPELFEECTVLLRVAGEADQPIEGYVSGLTAGGGVEVLLPALPAPLVALAERLRRELTAPSIKSEPTIPTEGSARTSSKEALERMVEDFLQADLGPFAAPAAEGPAAPATEGPAEAGARAPDPFADRLVHDPASHHHAVHDPAFHHRAVEPTPPPARDFPTPIPDGEAEEPAARERPPATVAALLERLGPTQKMRLALSGSREERLALLRDINKMLHLYVLKNPRIQLDEVQFAARSSNLAPEALKFIAEHVEWGQNPQVCAALVRNPKTPMDTALRVLDRVPESELRNLARGGGRAPLVQAARRKLIS